MKSLVTIDLESWETPVSTTIQKKAVEALEGGKSLRQQYVV